MTVVALHLPSLYPKQRAAFFGNERISCTEATTKAGKSVGALTWLLSYGTTQAIGKSLLWCSPVYSQARVMFDRMVRWLLKADPTRRSGWNDNRSELFVTLPGGARVYFKGSDNPDTIYGSDYSAAVIDEASRCREEAWHAVRSTTTATRGPIRLIGNVRGRKNWAYKLARRAEAGEPDMSYHKITAHDAVEAGVLDADEIVEAQRHLPEAVFRQLYLAEAGADDGNPFGGSDAIGKCIDLRSESPAVVYGIDLAKSVDWTWVIGLDSAGRWTHSERWQSPWEETFERIEWITRGAPIVVDSTGVGDPIVERLQRGRGATAGFKFSTGSKQQIMERLAVAIQQREITIPDGALVAELEAYEYQYTRTGVRYSAPEGMHDDGVCALALAVHGMSARVLPFDSASVAFPSIEHEAAPWD
jgi:hypothetical protein